MIIRNSFCGVSYIALTVAFVPFGVYAQVSTPAPSTSPSNQSTAISAQSGPAEIVVTAQKRSERLVDVPLSISAASGALLARSGITDTAGLSKIAPGFVATQTASATPVYTIRGIGYYDSALAATPAVTVYVDQVPLTYPSETRNAVFDLERVEVLKGPQGTLFGQNSTGGAVNYIAAKPSDHLTAGFDITGGRFKEADGEAFVSGPLTDALSVRVAIGHDSRGDWQESSSRPGDTRGAIDVSKARLLVAWHPTSRFRALFSASGWIDKSDTQAAQLVAKTSSLPPSPLYLSYPLSPQTDRAADWSPGFPKARNDNFYQLSGRLDYDLTDHVSLTSISAYSHFKLDAPVDADGTALALTNYLDRGTIQSFDQELRAEGHFGGTRIVLGGNYSHDKADQNTLLGVTDASNPYNISLPGLPIQNIRFIANQRIRTIAGFANIEQKLTEKLTLQGGVRYTDDRRDFSGCLQDVDGRLGPAIAVLDNFVLRPAAGLTGTITIPANSCASLDANLEPVLTVGELHQHNVSFRVGPNWKISPDTLLYANLSKGYKAGTFPTIGAVLASQYQPTTQESVTAYEIGLKTKLSRNIQVSGAAFYYNYRNKQLLGTVLDPLFGPLQKLLNIPKSRLYGFEAQVTAQPFRGLTLTGGGTYVNSKVTSSFENFNPYGTAVNFKGESFPFTPRWQAIADAQYSFSVSARLTAFAGANVYYQSHSVGAFGSDVPYNPAEPEHTNQFGQNPNLPDSAGALDIRSYATLDLRVGVETSDHVLSMSLWGRNVTNKYYWTNATFVPSDSTVRYAGMPATYGFTLKYRFGS